MNASYDKVSAVVQLEHIFESSMKTEGEPVLLIDIKVSDYRVRKALHPPNWKIVDEDDTEAYFRVYGIICLASLPPVKMRGKQSNSSIGTDYLQMQQRLTITGLGSQAFEKCTAKLDELMNLLHDNTGSLDIQPLDGVVYESHPTITAQNRYFSERRLVPNLPTLSFLPGVDDYNVLRQCDPQRLIHCAENRVDYVESVCGRKKGIHPKTFVPGDIVEMVFSISGIPIKHNRIKSVLVLRGVCLLDPTFRLRSRNASSMAALPSASSFSINVKRRSIYLDDDEDELSKRMKISAVSSIEVEKDGKQ